MRTGAVADAATVVVAAGAVMEAEADAVVTAAGAVTAINEEIRGVPVLRWAGGDTTLTRGLLRWSQQVRERRHLPGQQQSIVSRSLSARGGGRAGRE